MIFKCVGTGSKGNAYICDYGKDVIILDCGVSFDLILQALEFDVSRVRAIFVTHEHGDHAKGVKEAIGYGLDVYCTEGTAEMLGISLDPSRMPQNNSKFNIEGLFTCYQFPCTHDAADPCGWMIKYNPTGETLLYATDTNKIPIAPVKTHYFIMECNYSEKILLQNKEDGRIPSFLPNRLIDTHMSIENLVRYFRNIDTRFARKILLTHLSDVNSNEKEFVEILEKETAVDTIVCYDGMETVLSLYGF